MKILMLLIILLFNFNNIELLFAKDNVITIYCDKKIGQVNNKVFGGNFIAYDPKTYENFKGEHYGYSDYGAGIWDPKAKRPVKEVINLAKEAGMSIVRFPGGCGTHHYDWKDAIGEQRKHFLYGIDEFLKTCEEMSAEAVITISYFRGCEHDASDLVEYLTSPDDWTNPNGGIDWAKERAMNGHVLPYSNVKYFEIGNEVWHGDHRNIKAVSPEEYGKKYLKYYEAMKAVNPEIKIGVVLYEKNWDTVVLNIIKDKLDFGVAHIYPGYGLSQERLWLMSAKEIFTISLGSSIIENEPYIQGLLELLKRTSGKDMPLAITEYNGGFVQDKPVPYRHCLGTALLNAEMLRILMKPENKILMANYWQFCNSYWGMIESKGDYMQHDYREPIKYIKRPNYYIFELYNRHFGSELLATDVDSGTYKVQNFSIPYLSVNASINSDKSKVYLMVINKNLDKGISATVDLRGFDPTEKGEAWILNGQNIDSINKDDANNVEIRQVDFVIKDNSFKYTFEPHSLTAVEIKSRSR
ncbi:MAG TPA: hypothetical protein DCY56_00725 [Candidatus Omnitrophica bacterium]|nr:hypothetical protein [Candidatus Omnitrophota bacterium]